MSVLPLFPLGSFLVPGQVLTLNIFEPRYRRLVADLRELSLAERRFGVVAITAGHEVGVGAAIATSQLGTIARVRRIDDLPDDRAAVTVVGRGRFRLLRRHAAASSDHYDRADVVELPDSRVGDPPPPETELLADRAAAYLMRHLELLGRPLPQLPEHADQLSFAIMLAVPLSNPDTERLLAFDNAHDRLTAEIAIMRRESHLVESTRSMPMTGPATVPLLS